MGPNATTRLALQHSTVRPVITDLHLCGWLGAASPGDILQYHRGFVLIDRDPQLSRLRKHDREELNRMCRRAHWAAERGLAHLLQRRHGEYDYGYLIVARPRPKAMSITLLAELGAEAA